MLENQNENQLINYKRILDSFPAPYAVLNHLPKCIEDNQYQVEVASGAKNQKNFLPTNSFLKLIS